MAPDAPELAAPAVSIGSEAGGILKRAFRCMTTEIEIFLAVPPSPPAEAALAHAQALFLTAEARFSRFQTDSELCRLNSAPHEEVHASVDLCDLVQRSIAAARLTGGIFDPCILDALESAGYDRSIELVRAVGGSRGPVSVVLAVAGRWTQIEVDARRGIIRRPVGLRLDLGGIGKGWAVDRAAQRLQSLGAGMVNAGGDLRAWGDQPGSEPGGGWLVAVDDPACPGRDVAWFRVQDRGLATSSVTNRCWREGHHLIDPRTGRPAVTNLLSSSVLAPTTEEAEIAAKAALILGQEDGLRWLGGHAEFEALLVTDSGLTVGTQGLRGVMA